MYQTTLHKGNMLTCKVCSPEYKPKRERFERRPRFTRATTLEANVRRQMAGEIGEDELSKDFRFALMQKYGVIAPRIDRRVTKPIWMEEHRWRQLKQQFHEATRGLVPQRPVQQHTTQSHRLPGLRPERSRPQTKKWSGIKFKNPQAQARHNQKYKGQSPRNNSEN